MNTIYITTTAELSGDQEISAFLQDFPSFYQKDVIEINGTFGTKQFHFIGGNWLPVNNSIN